MTPQTILGWFFDTAPILRRIWRWLLERGLEVKIEPLFDYVVQYADPAEQLPPAVYANFNLTLANHRTDRPERIVGCYVVLKKRRFLMWQREVFSIPASSRHWLMTVGSEHFHGTNDDFDILLEPMASPTTIEIVAFGEGLPADAPDGTYDLVLVLNMMGPIRRLERKLTIVKHRPSGKAA